MLTNAKPNQTVSYIIAINYLELGKQFKRYNDNAIEFKILSIGLWSMEVISASKTPTNKVGAKSLR